MLENQKVLVIGSGISGIGAVKLLLQAGAIPYLYDANEKLKEEEIHQKLKSEISDEIQIPIYIGTIPKEVQKEMELVVLSPGVPTDLPFLDLFKEAKVPLIGEIELGYYFEKGKVVAITGTNGKTTTTTLVGEIMKAYFEKVFVVGNIGNPYTLEALKTSKDSVTVGEISSFQLETIHTFQPKVSAILNVTPDHLNRHHTMEAYVQAKENIAKNQTKDHICVLNYENDYTREFGKKTKAEVVWFSSKTCLENGYYQKGDKICFAKDGNETVLMDIYKDMNLVGQCNVENVMAAIAISTGMNVPMDTILSVIRTFKAVEHRIEFVATKNGVDYYNDSKGTNPDAAIQGIKAMRKPTVLIGGGYDKQSEYDEWIEAFEGKVKELVLIGQTREKIAECAKKHGFSKIVFKDTFEEACSYCTQIANTGDAVLLSPACASWGMFPNYEVRGKMFKEYVNSIKE